MSTEKLVKEFLHEQGINFLMTMHILTYSNEEKINIHEIIQKFIDNKIDPKEVLYISFSGYKSFKRFVKALD